MKLYFALNGALHDAAIATWGAKRDVRLRAPDLDDPLARLRRPVERPAGALVQPRRAAARPGPRRARHEGVERARAAPRGARRPRRRRRCPDGARLGARHALDATRWSRHSALAGLGLGRQRVRARSGSSAHGGLRKRRGSRPAPASGRGRHTATPQTRPGSPVSTPESQTGGDDLAGRRVGAAVGTQGVGARAAVLRGNGSLARGRGWAPQRPDRTCSRRAIVSSVTASSRMTPVTT